MSDAYFSIQHHWQDLSPEKLKLLLKCLLILQTLPEAALQEAAEELEDIAQFHAERSSLGYPRLTSTSQIKGKLEATQLRPPIVLEP